MSHASIHSLAVTFPSLLRTNDFWHKHHPAMVGDINDRILTRVWAKKVGAPPDDPWALAMDPYLKDPFRGARERRWLAPGETALGLEVKSARDALAAADLTPEDIDLALVCSFQPDQPGVGNAAFLAKELGLRSAAWNLESACSSALVGLQTASCFLAAGEAKRVLLVISCTYSRAVTETNTLAWSVGDAACAFVVGPPGRGAELLSFHTLHTAQTCGVMAYELVERDGKPALQMCAGDGAAAVLRDTAEWGLAACSDEALRKAGLPLSDVGFFAITTPTAWWADYAARRYGYTSDRTFNSHPMTANTGPVLTPQNLFYGAKRGRLRSGDLVLAHTMGSVSTASSAVLRWGDVALGPEPAPPTQGE
jgi:3-oxoacyl-[acyl-carrier-protein] synthase-3